MKVFAVFLVFLVFSFSAFGQSNVQIERNLVAALKEIQKYSVYAGNYDEEKIEKAQAVFEETLLKYTKMSATLGYKFGELSQLMYVATSDDAKFRIYSWDLEDGGTMHNFARVYQYLGADGKVYSITDKLEEGDPGSFVYDIFSLDAVGDKVYIVCSNFIGSTQDHGQSADLYQIAGSELKDKVKLIKTKSGLTDTLNFGYNFFSIVDRSERPVKLISFDRKTKTLKIPVVIEDKEFPNGRVTNRFISYRFDGKYFVKAN